MNERASAHRYLRIDAQPGLLLASGLATATGLVLAGQAAALMFSAAQAAALAALFVRALRGQRGWRSAEFVAAVAWLVLFTVPCWLYALNPPLLDQGTPARAALIVNIALYAFLLGLMLWRPTGPPVAGPVAVAPMQPRPRVLMAWWALGLVALAALLLRHGNPLEYLTRLDRSAALNLGVFYLVALAFAMRFAALAWAAGRWSRGEPLEPMAIALAAAGTLFIGLTGGRLFVAVALADFLLLYVLLRRPLPLRRVAPYAMTAGILVVFVAGTVKRYQGYNATHPDAQVGFTQYATKQAPSELADAYANNYVDTVRLVAITDRLVPRSAGWEGGRALLEMAVKPLPRPIRPKIDRQPVLQQAFSPTEQYAFAMPLIATAFLAGGIIVVVLVSLASGALMGLLDRRLSSETLTAGAAAVLVVAIVSAPSVLRAGLPAGATLFLVDVIGMWVVARTGLHSPTDSTRSAQPPEAGAGDVAMLSGTGRPN